MFLVPFYIILDKDKQKKTSLRKSLSVGVPGLEPGKAGPESAVLPLHHTPIWFASSALLLICGCKGTTFSRIHKIFHYFFLKNIKNKCFISHNRIKTTTFVA